MYLPIMRTAMSRSWPKRSNRKSQVSRSYLSEELVFVIERFRIQDLGIYASATQFLFSSIFLSSNTCTTVLCVAQFSHKYSGL